MSKLNIEYITEENYNSKLTDGITDAHTLYCLDTKQLAIGKKMLTLTDIYYVDDDTVVPETGDSRMLYVDTIENRIYRWDSETSSYVLLSENTTDEVNIIAPTNISIPPNAKELNSVAIGVSANAKGYSDIAIGTGSSVGEYNSGIAIGSGSSVSNNHGIAIGGMANSGGASGIAIGNNSKVSSDFLGDSTNSIALGNGANVKSQKNSIAIGSSASVSSNAGIAIGNGATSKSTSTDAYATVLGSSSTATEGFSTVVGANSESSGKYATSVGFYSNTYADQAVSLGFNSHAYAAGSMSLGTQTNVAKTGENSVAIGFGSNTDEARVVSVGSSTLYRRIINVNTPTNDHDAVTKAYADALVPETVTTIDESSTNDQIVTAKAVYDYIKSILTVDSEEIAS